MFDTNPEMQEICRQLRKLQYEFDFNEVEIQESEKFPISGADLQRLYDRQGRLQAEIYRLQHKRDTFYD